MRTPARVGLYRPRKLRTSVNQAHYAGAWTWEGTLDRAGAFVRGLSADSRDSQRRLRASVLGFAGIVVVMVLVGVLTHLF